MQIETPAALDQVDEIASVPGVDGLFIGPGDLSLRLDCPLDFNHPRMAGAQKKIAAAAARHAVAWGRPSGSAEDIKNLQAMGAQLIAHGSDFSSVAKGLTTASATFQAALT